MTGCNKLGYWLFLYPHQLFIEADPLITPKKWSHLTLNPSSAAQFCRNIGNLIIPYLKLIFSIFQGNWVDWS